MKIDIKHQRIIEAVYPLLGGGRGWVCSLKSHFPLHFALLTHPYLPPKREDNVLLLGIYPFEFMLSLTAMRSYLTMISGTIQLPYYCTQLFGYLAELLRYCGQLFGYWAELFGYCGQLFYYCTELSNYWAELYRYCDQLFYYCGQLWSYCNELFCYWAEL
jgi:hypothetical protein